MSQPKETDNSKRKFIIDTTKIFGLSIIGSSVPLMLTSCEKYWVNSTEMNEPEIVSLDSLVFLKLNPKFPARMISTMKSFGKKNYGIPVIILKVDTNTYACYSSMCTHNNCYGKEFKTVEDYKTSNIATPVTKNDKIICQCHFSEYDPFDHARVLKGPAEKSLKEFRTSFNPDTKELTIYF